MLHPKSLNLPIAQTVPAQIVIALFDFYKIIPQLVMAGSTFRESCHSLSALLTHNFRELLIRSSGAFTLGEDL